MARVRCRGILAACLLAACPLAHGLGVRTPGKHEDTINGLLAALKRNPQDPDAHYRLGCAYARTSEFDKAVTHLEEAQQLRPGHEDTLAELAGAHLELASVRQGREGERHLAKAESAAKALLQLPPRQKGSYEVLARVALYRAQLFRDAGEPDKDGEACEEALGYYEKVLELEPKDISTHLERIRLLVDLRRLKTAEQRCNEVLKINGKLHEPKLILAQIRRADGDTEGALKVLTEVLAQKPTQIEAMLRRAEIYLDLQKYEEALADANEAIRLTNKNPYANFIRGSVYMQLKKLDQAIAELQLAAAGMPKHLPAHFWLARCLLMKDRLPEAIEELNVVAKLDPRFTSARLVLVSAHLQNGDPDRAIATLTDFLRHDPKNFEVYRLLAMAHLQRGDQKSAQQAFDRMLASQARAECAVARAQNAQYGGGGSMTCGDGHVSARQ